MNATKTSLAFARTHTALTKSNRHIFDHDNIASSTQQLSKVQSSDRRNTHTHLTSLSLSKHSNTQHTEKTTLYYTANIYPNYLSTDIYIFLYKIFMTPTPPHRHPTHTHTRHTSHDRRSRVVLHTMKKTWPFSCSCIAYSKQKIAQHPRTNNYNTIMLSTQP